MLVRDRLDLAIGDHLISQDLIGSDRGLEQNLTFIDPKVTSLPLHMAVVKPLAGYEEIIERSNRSLSKLKDSGRLAEIYSGYCVAYR